MNTAATVALIAAAFGLQQLWSYWRWSRCATTAERIEWQNVLDNAPSFALMLGVPAATLVFLANLSWLTAMQVAIVGLIAAYSLWWYRESGIEKRRAGRVLLEWRHPEHPLWKISVHDRGLWYGGALYPWEAVRAFGWIDDPDHGAMRIESAGARGVRRFRQIAVPVPHEHREVLEDILRDRCSQPPVHPARRG